MAKTTGKIKGNIRMLYMDDTLVGCTTANGMDGSNEVIEDTCKTGAATPPRTYQLGAQDATMTGEMIVKFDDENQYSAVAAAFAGQTEHTWKLATANADDPYWQMDGVVSAFSESANLNTPLTASFTISPTGPLYFFNT